MGTAGGPAGGTGGSAGAAATAGGFGSTVGLGCSPAGADGVSSAWTGGGDNELAAGTDVAGAAAVVAGAGVTAGTGSGRLAAGSPVLSFAGSTFAASVMGSAGLDSPGFVLSSVLAVSFGGSAAAGSVRA